MNEVAPSLRLGNLWCDCSILWEGRCVLVLWSVWNESQTKLGLTERNNVFAYTSFVEVDGVDDENVKVA